MEKKKCSRNIRQCGRAILGEQNSRGSASLAADFARLEYSVQSGSMQV